MNIPIFILIVIIFFIVYYISYMIYCGIRDKKREDNYKKELRNSYPEYLESLKKEREDAIRCAIRFEERPPQTQNFFSRTSEYKHPRNIDGYDYSHYYYECSYKNSQTCAYCANREEHTEFINGKTNYYYISSEYKCKAEYDD